MLKYNENINKSQLLLSKSIQSQEYNINDILVKVIDSKPKTFKRPPQPGYTVKRGEKWVTIKEGKMEFEDIEIKD